MDPIVDGVQEFSVSKNQVWVPGAEQFAHFTDRAKMRDGGPERKFALPERKGFSLPAPGLPIDWAKTLPFPMFGNDQLGDCFYAAACHQDQTWTGNNGGESTFDVRVIARDYLRLSGGDNGLSEGAIVGEWKRGLCETPKVNILDALDIDVTDQAAVQVAINYFGGVLFTLAVPDAWIQGFRPGGQTVWNAPARPNPRNGHAVLWNGVDEQGRYRLQTWGSYCWITPQGARSCDPGGFVAFSLRWFNSSGIAPNGMTYDQLAALWVSLGGHELPPSPFNPPPPPPPPGDLRARIASILDSAKLQIDQLLVGR